MHRTTRGLMASLLQAALLGCLALCASSSARAVYRVELTFSSDLIALQDAGMTVSTIGSAQLTSGGGKVTGVEIQPDSMQFNSLNQLTFASATGGGFAISMAGQTLEFPGLTALVDASSGQVTVALTAFSAHSPQIPNAVISLESSSQTINSFAQTDGPLTGTFSSGPLFLSNTSAADLVNLWNVVSSTSFSSSEFASLRSLNLGTLAIVDAVPELDAAKFLCAGLLLLTILRLQSRGRSAR